MKNATYTTMIMIAMVCCFVGLFGVARAEPRASRYSFRTNARFSSSCKYTTELTAPWNALGFPVAEGRVCSSTEARAEMQYVTKHKPHWELVYDQAMLDAGFVKDRCSDMSCTYVNGGSKVTVQVIETSSWITVVARR